jgi:hypothetical protein
VSHCTRQGCILFVPRILFKSGDAGTWVDSRGHGLWGTGMALSINSPIPTLISAFTVAWGLDRAAGWAEGVGSAGLGFCWVQGLRLER